MESTFREGACSITAARALMSHGTFASADFGQKAHGKIVPCALICMNVCNTDKVAAR
jgi:hypothetical protein